VLLSLNCKRRNKGVGRFVPDVWPKSGSDRRSQHSWSTRGIQLIELCGAFGPVWTARIIDAIDDAVPVGFVAYGAEAIAPMHRLFE
jgi:hypothetical protein